MLTVIEVLLPVFALVGLGLMLRRRGVVPEEKWVGVERVCYWLFFPAILAKTLIGADLRSIPLTGIAATMLTTFTVIGVLTLALRPMLKRCWGLGGPAYTSIFQSSTRWNAFIALAVVIKLFGSPGVALIAVVMAVMVPLVNTVNVLVLAAFAADHRLEAGHIARMVARNPLIGGCLAGLAINLLQIPVWEPIMTLLDLLGRAALGAGLLCVGAGLRIRFALHPTREVWLASALKLLITPMIAGAAAMAFGLSGPALQTAVLCGAVPTAMNGYIMARQMGGDADLYAGIVTVQTSLSVLSIPLWLWLATAISPAV